MTEIARLKVELDEMEPQVLRCIEVPKAIRLDRLHVVIQAAMGWENYHLYEFRVGRTVAYGIPDPDWPEQNILSAEKATLTDLLDRLEPSKSFHYIYDFGDDWLHTVTIEAIVEADPNGRYPHLVTAQGRCPPEDSGGPWGYAHYIEVIADPDHEDHKEILDWLGPNFDPHSFDENAFKKAFEKQTKPGRQKVR